jgi:hypothetical protein
LFIFITQSTIGRKIPCGAAANLSWPAGESAWFFRAAHGAETSSGSSLHHSNWKDLQKSKGQYFLMRDRFRTFAKCVKNT